MRDEPLRVHAVVPRRIQLRERANGVSERDSGLDGSCPGEVAVREGAPTPSSPDGAGSELRPARPSLL